MIRGLDEGDHPAMNSNLLGTLVGAVIGAAAALVGGVVAAHNTDQAQAQLQVQTTRRTVYAEFLTSSADVCTALAVHPFDSSQSNSAFSAFVGKAGAVVLVAPPDVRNAAQAVDDYLAGAIGSRPGANVPDGCGNAKFFSLTNGFLDVAKNELDR
jgi:hypothetical protein